MTAQALTDRVGRVLPQDMADRLRAVGAQLDDVDDRARHVIEERPLLAVAIALAAGYVLARLLRRS
jgi:ElaB/YqjD/DUF883 family membrane-anchored ribosome-binding protein